jgi:outer membrane protein TolC
MYSKDDFSKITTALALILLFCGLTLSAQQSLSLEEAINKGLVNNYQVRISRASVAIAENNNDWALAGKAPEVNLTLSSDNSYSSTNNPASVVTESSIITNAIVPGVAASWLLYNGSRINYTKEQLAGQVELSNEQLEGQIQNTIQSIISSYYGALVQREQLAVLEEVLGLSRDRIRYQEARQEFGQAGTFDLVQAQDAYLNDSTTYLIQQISYQNAVRNLQLVMGVTEPANYVLTDELEYSNATYTKSELEGLLLQNNPELQASSVNLRLATLNTEIISTNRLPQVSLNAGGNYNVNVSTGNQTFNFGGMPDERDLPGVAAKTLRGFVNLTASYNIYDGGARRQRVETAQLQEIQSQLQYASLEQNLKIQLANTYATYENQRALVELTSNLVANARRSLTIGEERQSGGLINSFDYRSIQLGYINATQARLNAILNLKNTETELLRLTGELVR